MIARIINQYREEGLEKKGAALPAPELNAGTFTIITSGSSLPINRQTQSIPRPKIPLNLIPPISASRPIP